jgi:Tol biopolymer transport system component
MKRSTVLIVVLTTLLGPIATVGSATAKVPGPNGRILFVRDTRHCEGCHLTTINPDGTHPDRLPAGFDSVRWSPDGSRIASAMEAPDGRLTTFVMDSDGSNPTVFDIPDPSLNLVCVVWSADGTRLICEGWDDKRPHRAAGMFSVDATDGQNLVQLTSNPYGDHDIPGDTSPDGTKIVFSRHNPQREHRQLGLYVADIDGSNVTQIGGWKPNSASSGSWSPDGSRILFAAKGSLWTISPDGTGRAEIALQTGHGFSFALSPGWSPDGTRIVFSLYLESTDEVDAYTAAADGTDLVQVTDTPAGEFSPDWGPAPVTSGA